MSESLAATTTNTESLQSYQFFGNCGIRWTAVRRETGKRPPDDRRVCLQVASVPRHAGHAYGDFEQGALMMEIPLKDLQGIALVLLGHLPQYEARFLDPGAVVKSLTLRYQRGEATPYHFSMRHAQIEHATAFESDVAFHMSMVIQTLLEALYPQQSPQTLRDNFLRTAAAAHA